MCFGTLLGRIASIKNYFPCLGTLSPGSNRHSFLQHTPKGFLFLLEGYFSRFSARFPRYVLTPVLRHTLEAVCFFRQDFTSGASARCPRFSSDHPVLPHTPEMVLFHNQLLFRRLGALLQRSPLHPYHTRLLRRSRVVCSKPTPSNISTVPALQYRQASQPSQHAVPSCPSLSSFSMSSLGRRSRIPGKPSSL